MCVAPFRQAHAIAENRLEHRRQRACLRTKTHTRTGMGEPSYGAYHAALNALGRAEFFARVNTDAAHLFLPAAVLAARKLLAHGQRTAGDFEI